MFHFHKVRRYFLSLLKGTSLEHFARKVLQRIVSPKGAQYDKLTEKIIRLLCHEHANCIDIGAYRGDILRIFLNNCSSGQIFAFEPIPENYQFLQNRYPAAYVYNIALSDKSGSSDFFLATGRPARSGLIRQQYPDPKENVEKLVVQTDCLDNLIDQSIRIDFIKIDVEGSELEVLKGAQQIIKRDRPSLLFEHRLTVSTVNSGVSGNLYELINSNFGLDIWPLHEWLNGSPPLNREQFLYQVSTQQEYYFLANDPDQPGNQCVY